MDSSNTELTSRVPFFAFDILPHKRLLVNGAFAPLVTKIVRKGVPFY